MAEGREHYASGNWVVKEGSEEDFITRWKDWLTTSASKAPGFGSATLIRDILNPNHFISLSTWDDAKMRDTWKNSSEFAEGMARVRELTDSFSGGDYVVAIRV
ncbi:MAG: antibiotic biosynthesis monooxygenase family protein [Actinomycetota bacterium]